MTRRSAAHFLIVCNQAYRDVKASGEIPALHWPRSATSPAGGFCWLLCWTPSTRRRSTAHPQKKYGSLPVRPISIKAMLRGRHSNMFGRRPHRPHPGGPGGKGVWPPGALLPRVRPPGKAAHAFPRASSGPCQLLVETREFIADARAKFVPVTTTSKSLPRTQPQLATIYRS